MTWVMYEFYHLKVTKRLYSCICTKSKARQNCVGAVIFTVVPTVRTVMPKITLEGCIMRPLTLSSVLLEGLKGATSRGFHKILL